MNMTKRDKTFLIGAVLLIMIVISWGQISMFWTETTCAKIIDIKQSRGNYVWFVYNRNGETVKDNMSLSFFSVKTLEKLQKKECCLIRYSTFWPYKVEIIDDDLKAK